LFERALEGWDKEQERAKLKLPGFERIEVLVQNTGYDDLILKAFVGRWLLRPDPEDDRCYSGIPGANAGWFHGIAQTRKGNFVVVSSPGRDFEFTSAYEAFEVFDDLDDVQLDDIAEHARTALRGGVEE